MKYLLLTVLLMPCLCIKAQKFILLDQHLAEPVRYADDVTSQDKFNDFFPVEKKMLPQFVKILEEIKSSLSQKNIIAKDYVLGCIKFKGLVISLARGQRADYIVTSECDNIKISMHLCDAKVANASNAFFISTWIQYIRSYVK